MALPFLPPNDMGDGLNYVVSEMNRLNIEGSPRLSRYFSRMWLPIAAIISVYERRTRTNNVSESFHKQAKEKIGIRQGIWTMLGKSMYNDNNVLLCLKNIESLGFFFLLQRDWLD